MDKPDDDLDAQLARNVAILRNRMDADVARLRTSLEAWIDQHSGPACGDQGGNFPTNYVEISNALLNSD
jgi:hypothetical protein